MFVVPLRVEMPNLRNYITTLWEYLQCTYRSFAVSKLHSVISFFLCLSSADIALHVVIYVICWSFWCGIPRPMRWQRLLDPQCQSQCACSVDSCDKKCAASRASYLHINATQLTVGLWKSWRIRIHHHRHRQHQHNNSSSIKSLWWWFCSKAAFVFIIPSHTEWTLTVR